MESQSDHNVRSHRGRLRRTAVCGAVFLAAALVLAEPPRAAAESQPLAATALSLCREADHAPPGEERALLRHGLQAAEQAVRVADDDPAAHFATFCNLGKLMRLDGVSVKNLVRLRQLRHEVDRTLELQPGHVDALLGKAALLYYTPRLLGGDPATSEQLLRTAISLAPARLDAQLALARLLSARGKRREARAMADRALQRAQRRGDPAKVAEAEKILDTLVPD
jgi:tetratricopeptide (TPR) repeat protein